MAISDEGRSVVTTEAASKECLGCGASQNPNDGGFNCSNCGGTRFARSSDLDKQYCTLCKKDQPDARFGPCVQCKQPDYLVTKREFLKQQREAAPN